MCACIYEMVGESKRWHCAGCIASFGSEVGKLLLLWPPPAAPLSIYYIIYNMYNTLFQLKYRNGHDEIKTEWSRRQAH